VYCRRARRLRAPAIVFLVFLAAGCSRAPRPARIDRLAVLRFENLGPNAANDWMGRAFSEIVTASLSAAPDLCVIPSDRLHSLNQTLGVRPISAPGISSERVLAFATGASRIGEGEYAVRNGRLEARLTIEDPHTGRTLKVIGASAGEGDVIAAAAGLARQVSSQAIPFATRSQDALKAWVSALESGDSEGTLQSLERAIASDPDFGPPYRLLAAIKARQQDRAGARALLDRFLSRGTAVAELDRRRTEVDLANLGDGSEARQRALASLVKLTPCDPVAWRLLAQTALARREYPVSVEAFGKSLELEPDDNTALNQLGYAAAYAGDFDRAVGSLRAYQARSPQDPNPLDSLGDIHLIAGRFREAENLYLEAARKQPGFLNDGGFFKAAVAHLMTGDVPGADALAKQYSDARAAARDPLAAFHTAEWSWITGRRQLARQQLSSIANGPAADLASRAWSELAIWSLVEGNRPAAAESAGKAALQAGPASAGLSLVARFLAQPSASPAEWEARIQRLIPAGGSLRDLTLAWALLLDGHFQPATPLLVRVSRNVSPSSDEGAPVLLAWALVETGRATEAAPLLRPQPLPPSTGPGPTMCFYFPRLFQLRARLAEKLARPDEARENQRLYRVLSGQAGGQ
jgi:tetratricopeptide (TPR) repeat protein